MSMPDWFWIVFIVLSVVLGAISFVMSPPESVANWFVAKFELHPELRDEDVIVSIDGVNLDGDDKRRFTESFNRAAFLYRHYDGIPTYSGIPVVVTTRQGKHNVTFNLYTYRDHIDVVKQMHKKVVAYRLLSPSLQDRFLSLNTQDETEHAL